MDYDKIEECNNIIRRCEAEIKEIEQTIAQARVDLAAAEGRDLSRAKWGFGIKPPEGWICDGAGSFESICDVVAMVGAERAREWAALLFCTQDIKEWTSIGVFDPKIAVEMDYQEIRPAGLTKDSATALVQSLNI